MHNEIDHQKWGAKNAEDPVSGCGTVLCGVGSSSPVEISTERRSGKAAIALWLRGSVLQRRPVMKRILALMGLSALVSVALATDVSDAIARDASVGAKGASVSGGRASVSGGRGSVSASRDGASVGGRGGSVSASRDGASVGGRGGSVSASREGASVGAGGASVSASREGASVGAGGASVSARAGDAERGSAAPAQSGGFVNAAGDREYDDLGSWFEDLARSWSGSEPMDNTGVDKGSATTNSVEQSATTNSSSVEQSGTTNSNSVKQVSVSSSTDGGSAKASNTNVTRQN
jgi:hypothetical protein